LSPGTDPEEKPSSEPPDPTPPASLAPLGTGSPARFDELSGRGGRKKLGLASGEGPASRPAPPAAFRFRPGQSGNPGVDNQAELMRHQAREQFVSQRTGLLNALRGRLGEIGVTAPQGA